MSTEEPPKLSFWKQLRNALITAYGNPAVKVVVDTLVGPFRGALTVVHLLWNKGAAISLTGYIGYRVAKDADKLPYPELAYALIIIAGTASIAPILRLLVFPEAAEYAEKGRLREDISLGTDNRQAFTPELVHYWFATAISYGVTVAGLVALQ